MRARDRETESSDTLWWGLHLKPIILISVLLWTNSRSMVQINSFRTPYILISLCRLQKLEPHEMIQCTDSDLGQCLGCDLEARFHPFSVIILISHVLHHFENLPENAFTFRAFDMRPRSSSWLDQLVPGGNLFSSSSSARRASRPF
jgi:hypothetical protein